MYLFCFLLILFFFFHLFYSILFSLKLKQAFVHFTDIEKANRKREMYERHRQRGKKKTTDYQRRRKRSVSSEKHVETLVVVDPVMMNYYFNEDMETYVLTIMNIVSFTYHLVIHL